MVISQTPYRVSFAGGGTDLPEFYRREWGAVLNVTLNRHLYVCVHGRFTPDIRMAYSRTEICARAQDLRHEIAREALQLTGLDAPLEITTIGDVPAGTGMGSSSAVAVGLLHAFYAYLGRSASPERLAREACHIELDRLGKPIGKQDQYAASFGGLNYLRFLPDLQVEVRPLAVSDSFRKELEDHLLLVYTEKRRSADLILGKQKAVVRERMSTLRGMRDLAGEMLAAMEAEDIEQVGHLLDTGWALKRSLGCGISEPEIDQAYAEARRAGALGGKLLGAGGGGFLLLVVPPGLRSRVLDALHNPRWLPFEMDPRGSRLIFRSESGDPIPPATPHAAAEG